jgi:hypothetical protein
VRGHDACPRLQRQMLAAGMNLVFSMGRECHKKVKTRSSYWRRMVTAV